MSAEQTIHQQAVAGHPVAAPSSAGAPPERIGQALIRQGLITRDLLEVALVEQKEALAERPDSMGHISCAVVEILSRMQVCEPAKLREALAAFLQIPGIDLATLEAPGEEFNSGKPLECALELARGHNISVEWMRQAGFLPFAFAGKRLSVALSQPQDLDLIDAIAERLPAGIAIEPHIAIGAEIDAAINRLGLQGKDPRHQVAKLGQQLEQCIEASQQHEVLVALIDRLLEAALFERASDIHFAPSERTLRVLFRIDGVLQTRYRIHPRFAPAVTVRIKVLSNLDISEARRPQDGSFKDTINGVDCDLRVSTLPTQFGESVVMRLHARDLWRRDLGKSGFPDPQVAQLKRLLRRPHGLMLIAGPTGSGKSSTLYALVKSLNLLERNAVTLEDPIEYSLGEAIRQTAINEAIGLSFAVALRSTLRQDPDVIMIGEIRDRDTAEMSLRMSMTGHLVLATIHSDSALSVHLRLRLLGLEPELFADQLIACMSQRLARLACPRCCYLREPAPSDNLEDIPASRLGKVLDVRGCESCEHTGYQGRKPLLEIFELDTASAELIANGASRAQIHASAAERGFAPLREMALRMVVEQKMTPAEATRIVG